MKNKKEKITFLTVKEYAEVEGVSTSAIYLRIERNKLDCFKRYGLTFVLPDTDKSIKKPRKKAK